MSQPLGDRIGCGTEVRAALDVLAGGGDPRLRELTVELAAEALVLAGRTPEAARAELERKLSNGSALAAYEAMARAHAGDPDETRLARPRATLPVPASRSGFVSAVDTEALGWIAVGLGAGRRHLRDHLDLAAGVTTHARVGDRVSAGQPLLTLEFGDREVNQEEIRGRAERAVAIADEAPPPIPLVAARLGASA
jgi:thymidine phosphorylase